MTRTMKVASSRIENGIEICNTCACPAWLPYRYTTPDGKTRGCIASCHDQHIRRNIKPSWMAPRYVLPKWVTLARGKVANFERVTI